MPAAEAAGAATVTVDGIWLRHVGIAFAATALDGRVGYGRWGTEDGFPVLYLGRPLDSVVVEAYRHGSATAPAPALGGRIRLIPTPPCGTAVGAGSSRSPSTL